MRSSSRSQRLAIAAIVTVLVLLSGSTIPLTTSAQSDTAPEQPSGLSTEAGDTQVRLSWEDPDDSTIDKYELWQIAESATLTAANNEFGYSVAVAGDIAVIGMPDDDESSPDSGAALVFSRVDGVWTQKYRLRTGDDAGVVKDDGFGSSIAFDGETIVVGAPFDDSKKGAAYLFVKPGDGWDNPNGTDPVDLTDPAKLTAPNAAVEDEFGYSVAMDGNTVVVGAYSDDSTDTGGNPVANSGSAYVFTKPSSGGWVSTGTAATLTATDAAAGDEFGSSVAVDGNTVVVGASGDDGQSETLDFMGSAFVFVMPGSGGWVSTSTAAKLTAETRGDDDYFGRSVAIDGDTIVVGADEAENTVDGFQVKTGSAYVFTKPGTGWATDTETAKLTASDSAATDKFGYAVALDGDTVVVGAYGNDSSRGSAYVFTKPASGWDDGTEAAQLTASDRAANDRFGSSVALDGGTVVVGAQNNDTAYLFDIVDWEDIADSNAATKSHIVRRLTNDIEHTFRVRAVDGTEASDPSDYVSETPKAAAYPPARPRNFSVTQTGDGEVELTWDAHRYPLTVTGYKYKQDTGGGPSWTDIDGSDSSTVSHIFKGLTAVPSYTFAILAVNSAGSTESDSRSLKLSEAPAAPDSFSAVAGDEQVWLGWRSPADFSISGYEYRQKEGTDAFGDWQTIPGSRSGTTFHIVTGLTNSTSYTFQVRAVNAAGESGSSGEQSATPATASSAPVKPEGFSATQTGDGEVELTWEASSNPVNVTGYQFKQNSGSWTAIWESDHSAVSHTITGLTQGVTYTFRVRAVNSAGSAESDSQPVTVVAKPAAPYPFAAEAGDTQVRLTWEDPVNASITKYQLWQFPPTSIKLISNDRAELDELGWSVAVDGDTLVIGALGDDPDNTGAAYVFTRDDGGWTQVGKLTAAVRRNDAGFGYGVAVHGDTIVVGAYEDDIEGDDAGAAYVFTRPATGWADMTQTARLTADDAAENDEFGTSVAVHGDTIVVGAPEEDALARGSAYIFTRPADGWGNWSTLDADGKAGLTATLRGQSNGDRFGRSVAVHGDTVVVGAHEEGANDQGEAYVFTKSAATGVWDDWDNKEANDATARLTASDRANGDRFGRAVAMDGDTIVVGALYNDYDDTDGDTDDNEGAAYVFTEPTGGWGDNSDTPPKYTETAKLTASDGAEDDQFGISVAVDGDTVLVGADGDDSNRGSAYVFTKPPNGWTVAAGTDKRTIYDRRGDDRFGKSVAVDGDTVLVGAVGDDSDKGSAYVFGTEWSDIPGSGAGTTSHIATRLPNEAEHTFRVRAVNAAGEGGASEVAATPVAANLPPSGPADFTATQTGVGKVLLTWKPSDSPLTVSRYRFYRGESGSGTWADIDGSDSSTTSHTVTGLTTGDTYTFDLRAVNGGGQNAAGSQSVTLEAQTAAPSGFTADVGDEQVKLTWDDLNDPTIDKYQSLQIDPSKLFASDGAADDEFGISVAVDGDIAVVGARQDDTRNGSAYVFTKVSGVWSQAAKLTASDGAADDEFGYSVAVDGDTIVVGAHQNDADTNNNDEGAAYVFTKPANGWGGWSNLDTNGKAGLTTKLTAFSAAAGDEFGISVAVDGDTIVVGAHQNDSKKGGAYIFTKFSGVWGNAPVSGNHRVETAKLVAADAAADDEFGISVAVHGDTIVVGAHLENAKDDDLDTTDDVTDSGAAYVFTKVSGVWSQKAKLIASDGAANDEFGSSVAVDGDTVIVGARQDDTRNGSAYVFTKVSGVWSQKAKLIASDGAANDEFGISVAVEGDTVIVGANLTNHIDSDGNAVNDSGSAYVFTRDSAGGWSQKAKLTASDAAAEDLYGYSVAVSGDTVVVGAPYNDYDDTDGDTNDDEGAAYFLSVLEWAGIVDILDSDDGTRSHIVTGLTNDVEHTFQVRGVNAAGGGLASAGAGGTPTFAIPDPPNGLTADAGDAVVDLTWVDPEDSTIEKYQSLQITQGRKLTASSTDDPVVRGDGFGISVAVDGDTAVVGAYQDDDATIGANSGSAHVFTRSSPADPWSWAAKLTASDAAANDEFGIAVAVDGDTIVVGAHQNDSSKGAAYVFTWNSSNSKWEQKAKLTASDGATSDEFGISVAVHGETVVVGAHQSDADDQDNNEGAAYVFIKPGSGGWIDATETAKLTASDAAANDNFGISVAVDGGTVVVGAHKADYIDLNDSSNNLADSGAAYVFTKPGSGGWATATETAKLTASDGAADDEFGISVAVNDDEDTVVVGAHKYDVGVGNDKKADAGAVYVFTKPVNGWATSTSTANLIASDAAANDEFGISVAIDDDTIVVGAYLDDDNGEDSGSAYVFTQDSNGWSQKTKLTGPSRGKGYWLGHSVAVVGDTAFAGADKSNISVPDSGAVYLWTVPGWTDIANSDATTTSLTVTGLTNRVEYSLQVRAVDKVEGAGAGPPSEVRATPLKPRPAKPTGLSAAPGDTQVRLSWDLPGESSPPINSYQLWQHAENAILTAPSPTADDEFGYAVAIDGDTAVVGMPGEDNPDNSGAAFVYTRDSFGTWSQVARLRPSTPEIDALFGNSVALQGNIIVVGAPREGTGSSGHGAVYVFTKDADSDWGNDANQDHRIETAKLLVDGGGASDEFGWEAVAVNDDEDTVVVGAYNINAAYIFTRPAAGWADTTETLKLSRSGSSDDFGRSVAIDGDTIVVGASGYDSTKGSAFVFIEPDTGWANSPDTEVAELTAYSRNDNDKFGRSVAIDGDTIVVGANGNDYDDDDNDTDDDEGAAYVFIKPDTGWANSPGTETAMFTASDGKEKDQFGVSVAMDGDTVVIGADALNETNRSGSAYVFTEPAAGWVDSTEAAKLTGSGTANGDRFGLSVAVAGATVMVGANGQGANNEGAAYLYDIAVWADMAGSTGETRSHFVTGLTNGLEHTFAVRAVNDGGASGPSNQASAEPAAEATSPAKPRNFSAVQVGAGEVRLEWERSVQPLTIVRFDYTDDDTNWKEATGSHSTTVSYTVSDLMVDTTYTFAVRAANSAGAGVSSDPWSVTIAAAPDRPTALTAVAGDEQVELSWFYSGGQPSTTGFQYQQKTEGDFGDDWTDVTGSTWTTRSHIVTGLTNDIPYTFRVRAVNVTVGSEPSNTVTPTPEAARSRPARPTNFNAEQNGVGQVELMWDTVEARLTVTGYQYTDNGGSDWNNITGSDSGTVYHTVTGLTTETTYTFAVRAVNSGTLPGLPSVSRDVTIVGEPRRPTGLGATGGDTQATVRWRVPSDENDPPLIELLQISISTLTADDRTANDEFGYSVAIDGNTAVVGAYHRNLDGNTNVGVAYVFTKDSDDAWSQAATLTASDGAANDEFGISVAIHGNTIVVGARQDNTRNGAAYVFTKADDVAWANDSGENHKEEAAKLTASDAAADDEFGISVAIDGNTIVVGARQDDTRNGAAYVFTKADDVAWANDSGENHKEEAAKLIASDGAANDELGISVAIDGDTVVAGAHLHDINDNGTDIPNAGAAYVFTKPATGGWANELTKDHRTESARVTAPDGAAKDEFGISVAIDVDTVVVGAHQPTYQENNKDVDVGPGAAYVFTRDSNSGKWGQPVKLTASNGVPGDGFGISVAVDGNTAVVGAYLDDRDNAARDTGSTYVFARKSGVWSETLNLAGPNPGQGDRLGYSVAADDGTLLAGVPNDDSRRGSAYAMDISDPEWVDLVSTELTDDDGYYAYRVLDLTNDQQYAFRVRSVNVAANRPSAETVAATPMSAKPGRTEGLSAKAGNRRVTLSWDDPRDSSLTGYQYQHPPEQTKLTAGSDSSRFGESVAVDDGIAVVGAPKHNVTDNEGNAITDSGAAYVFTKVDGVWNGPIELTAGSDGAENDQFGYSVAVDGDGDTIVVGAYQHDTNDNADAGAAYVFTKDPLTGVWSEPVKLIVSDGAKDDRFGYSVAVGGDTVVVGAQGHNGNTGAAYVFTWDTNDGWSQTAKLAASVGAGFEYFGHSVAVHRETIVIGARGHSGTPGAAYVFTWDSENRVWGEDPGSGETHRIETAKLTASDANNGDQFGQSVAVDGATVVVGAQQDDSTRGSAYVFTKPTDNDWADNTETARLAASDRGASDSFGASVAIRGGTIVVGAYAANIDECEEVDQGGDCQDNYRSGAAYLFTKPANVDWVNDPNKDHRTESGKLTLPIEEGAVEKSDEFGNSVALDGQNILVGAPEGNDGFGSVYVSDIPQWGFLASGAETTSATVGGLTNGVEYAFQVRAIDSYGDGLPSNIALATPMPAPAAPMPAPAAPNRAPYFIIGSDTVTFTVDENTPPGSLVGDAVTATDPDGDVLTYSLSGIDASSFVLDGSTGQITVGSGTLLDYESGPTRYTVVVSVHDGRGAYGDDDSTIDDLIEVSIDVSNVDEAGTVSVSLEQPEVGTPVAVSLSDPDGSLSNISWQWARSSDGSDWSDISGANSDSYTPVADDVGIYLQATASYTDGHGPGKSAHAVMERQTAQRGPSFEGDVTFTVDENTPPGSLVGDAVTATDPDGDVLTYSLSGIDASSFVLDGSTGQITVGSGTLLDYESGPTRYTVVVSVHDGRGAYGDDDSTIDDLIEVSIDVSNVDEAGTVSVSLEQPEVGTALAVSLSDPDGSLSDISWQWARSSDGSDWSDISGANSDSYTPVADDVGIYLQATASYTDGHGPGKSAHAVMERQTAQRGPSFEGDVTFTVDENTPPGSLVGDAVTATDPDGDVLTYSLSGIDASSFVLDGSTGQITVGSGTLLDYESGPTRYTVVVSVHDGRGAYGDDDSTIDDLIEVSIDVSNVDEAGTVSVSLEQPEVGTALVVSLSDPDGSLSDISWQWARSSDGSDWSDISGANSDSYTPVADDVGIYLQATASYTDGHGPGKSAHAVMERQTAQRGPSFEGDVTFTVDENTPPGSLVGDAVTATDPDGDVLTYSLSGIDASSFVLDGSTGQITVGSGTLLDYESGPTRYTVVVSVHDGRGAYGDDDSTIDDLIEVSIDVSNVDEAGTVSVSLEQPEVGTALVVSLSDPDGSLSDISWQWARSSDRTDWQDMAGASSFTYTPVDLDADKYLRVTASYADGEGSGKQAQAVLNNPVQGVPEPVATPTTTATDTPAPSPTPTAEPAPSEADGGDEGFPWWVIVAVVIGVVAGVVLIIVVLRSRR